MVGEEYRSSVNVGMDRSSRSQESVAVFGGRRDAAHVQLRVALAHAVRACRGAWLRSRGGADLHQSEQLLQLDGAHRRPDREVLAIEGILLPWRVRPRQLLLRAVVVVVAHGLPVRGLTDMHQSALPRSEQLGVVKLQTPAKPLVPTMAPSGWTAPMAWAQS